MLFEFTLRGLDDIEPWGTPPHQSLSWFALTDGCYRLRVGNDYLFSYSDVAGRRLLAKYPEMVVDHVDYQVARLWEDICEILPDVIEPIPSELEDMMNGPTPSIREWVSAAYCHAGKFTDAEWDLEGKVYSTATDWWSRRRLDSLYLIAGPHVWFWSTRESVGITWDNRDRELEGVKAWSALWGSVQLPRDTFMAEVRDFNARLIDQMEKRVEVICHRGPRPGVQIDFDALRFDHAERTKTLDKALATSATVEDWNAVLGAMADIDRRWLGRQPRFGNESPRMQ